MSLNIVNSLESSAASALASALVSLGPGQSLVTANIPSEGIAGFLFDIPDEDRVELASDITDYHVEDNTSIQDNIALRPIKITLRGFVAELTLNNGSGGVPLSSYPPALPLLTAMVPSLSPQAQQIATATTTAISNATSSTQSQAQNLFQLVQSVSPLPAPVGALVQTALSSLGGSSPGSTGSSNKQANAFNFFYQLWNARTITISVETPWGVFNGMAIENLVAVQGRESKQMTDFTVTLKQIRIASTTIVNTSSVAGRAQAQSAASSPTPNGAVGQVPTTPQQTAQIVQGFTYTPP